MNQNLYYCIPAYNESNNIRECLASIANQTYKGSITTLVGLNGCTDTTESIVQEISAKFPALNIEIVHSLKGKSFSQNAMRRKINNNSAPIVFLDADVVLDKNCVELLNEELNRNNDLIIAGGFPVPLKPTNLSLWSKFLYNILHQRAFHPQSEISRNDVRRFKKYVGDYPQKSIPKEFEIKSKIYFHGRTYMLRNIQYFELPEDKDTVDDTYISNFIHYKYGPGTIRNIYAAKSFYKPYISIKEHFRSYRRFYLDCYHLDKSYPEFQLNRIYEQTMLNWSYILKCKPKTIILFLIYYIINIFEKNSFRILNKQFVSKLWIYNNK